MRRFNYTFKLTHPDHEQNEVTYQHLIRALKIENEVVHGKPLSEGGAPQAQTVKALVERSFPGVTAEVWYQGNQIF